MPTKTDLLMLQRFWVLVERRSIQAPRVHGWAMSDYVQVCVTLEALTAEALS